ncbi:hypothetical protein BC567DRAFT_84592 [Phyllosticta citribraziliensis]
MFLRMALKPRAAGRTTCPSRPARDTTIQTISHILLTPIALQGSRQRRQQRQRWRAQGQRKAGTELIRGRSATCVRRRTPTPLTRIPAAIHISESPRRHTRRLARHANSNANTNANAAAARPSTRRSPAAPRPPGNAPARRAAPGGDAKAGTAAWVDCGTDRPLEGVASGSFGEAVVVCAAAAVCEAGEWGGGRGGGGGAYAGGYV